IYAIARHDALPISIAKLLQEQTDSRIAAESDCTRPSGFERRMSVMRKLYLRSHRDNNQAKQGLPPMAINDLKPFPTQKARALSQAAATIAVTALILIGGALSVPA